MLAVVAALTLAACGGDPAGEGEESVCELEQVKRPVRGQIALSAALQKAQTGAPLRVQVYESHSIVSCEGGLISSRSPGLMLTSVEIDEPGSFSLEVVQQKLVAERPAQLELNVLLDENDNGECDEGELSASASTSDGSDVVIELRDIGCSARL